MGANTLPGQARVVSFEGDFYYRHAFDRERMDCGMPSVSVSATYWILGMRRLGIGYSFEVGRAPLSGFVYQRRAAISLTSRVGG